MHPSLLFLPESIPLNQVRARSSQSERVRQHPQHFAPDFVPESESVSHTVMSHSLQHHGLQPARLLCLWNSGVARILEWIAIPFLGDLPNSGNEPGSPELQADSLPSEPPGKPHDTLQSYRLVGWWSLCDIYTSNDVKLITKKSGFLLSPPSPRPMFMRFWNPTLQAHSEQNDKF